MSCEARQEQVSLLIDAELEETGQVALFRHLEGCSECRLFFHSMHRFRNAAKRDQEELNRTADEVLPLPGQLPIDRHRSGDDVRHPVTRPYETGADRRDQRSPAKGTRRWSRVLAGGWRMPAPVAVGLAMALLVAGAFVGARVSSLSGGPGLNGRAGHTVKPAVVVVCALPEVRVLGSGSRL